MRDLQPCGTPAAYQQHILRGEETCGDCRRAKRGENSVYQEARRQLRDLHRDEFDALYARERVGSRGYHRALTALVLNHQAQYRAFLAEIRRGS